MGILVFVLAILGSIMLHEAGHFATARLFGMKVEEFFVGFGPKLWATKRGDTTYGVKALPLGGYVRIAGMNPFEEPDPADAGRLYKSKKPWQRAIVLSAGSFMHFVIAVFVIAGIFAFAGTRSTTTTIAEVVADSPAAAAGVQPGDEVVAVDRVPIDDWADVQTAIRERPGDRIGIRIVREGERKTLNVDVGEDDRDGQTVGFIGVGPGVKVTKRAAPIAFVNAIGEVGIGAKASLIAFVDLFSPDTIGRLFSVASGNSERTIEDPATLIGVGAQANNLFDSGNLVGLLSLIAGFNIFIGVANLIPLPPLDGGHLAVLTYEKIRGRDVDLRKLVPVTMTVLLILGSMFALLLYLDIVKPLPDLTR